MHAFEELGLAGTQVDPPPLFELCKCKALGASAASLPRRALLQHFLSIREERARRVAYSITPSVF